MKSFHVSSKKFRKYTMVLNFLKTVLKLIEKKKTLILKILKISEKSNGKNYGEMAHVSLKPSVQGKRSQNFTPNFARLGAHTFQQSLVPLEQNNTDFLAYSKNPLKAA